MNFVYISFIFYNQKLLFFWNNTSKANNKYETNTYNKLKLFDLEHNVKNIVYNLLFIYQYIQYWFVQYGPLFVVIFMLIMLMHTVMGT